MGKGGDNRGRPNLKLLMLYADELDKVVGTPAKTGFSGGIETAIGNSRKGALEHAADAVISMSDKARNINKDGAYKSMYELLKKKSMKP